MSNYNQSRGSDWSGDLSRFLNLSIDGKYNEIVLTQCLSRSIDQSVSAIMALVKPYVSAFRAIGVLDTPSAVPAFATDMERFELLTGPIMGHAKFISELAAGTTEFHSFVKLAPESTPTPRIVRLLWGAKVQYVMPAGLLLVKDVYLCMCYTKSLTELGTFSFKFASF